MWYTVLQRREEFWDITPKKLFAQLDAHKKYNGVNEEVVKQETVDTTEFM
ncbi:TPA: hypothetical protein ACHTFF_002369 [Clostridioides difficile]|uniref:Uncharacterized protein n=1 Tax=Clostridioides difficile TaxID=1496 RepID=A0A069AGM9_CLODI|nr:hypothetical protein [Clostridioides difficile]EII6797781.1 hypothetical protein [Clostridioides difficile]EIJ0732476.1 hypothetical protein [Clostridioides difficile]EIS9082754.1 hypothetical protein [Clostridioides difficile]EIS9607059.1 hypothetical protein [Clostridioides difficile]EIS9781613.1 hypothetical protein [Clostridioides difficile]